ncbi:permease prefix domain 1-containing protein [Microbacterium sp.]|uniref:permease prefix domain 1-containing protein n=1 Tax=Microbacterium sp. TaxID=51671 RepID=UPI0026062BC6|nr:permease prefix domain 1-containing protein [Microbacterium sp.]
MTAVLTERYIGAVTKSLDPSAQDDVRVELEASIADAIEARTDQGEDQADAERTVLTELGDPAILAAGYADRPLHLIGPKYFLTWWRLLKLLLWIVPVTVAAVVAVGLVISDAPVGEIIGQTIAITLSVIVHLCFWTTLVFFVLERTGADTGVRWSVDSLPEVREDGASRSDLIASVVFLAIAVGALLWDRFVGFVFVATGEVDVTEGLGGQTTALPILAPGLWPWWITAALILIALEAALAVAVYAGRGWRPSLAVLNTVLAVVFAAGAVYLLVTGQLINPEFLAFIVDAGGDGFAAGDAEAAGEGGIFRILAVLTGAFIVGIAVWDTVDGWLKTRRAQLAA